MDDKVVLDYVRRMIMFLAPYVAALDDPSGEMTSVVKEVKDAFSRAKQ